MQLSRSEQVVDGIAKGETRLSVALNRLMGENKLDARGKAQLYAINRCWVLLRESAVLLKKVG